MKNCFQGVIYTEPDTIQIIYNSCGIINTFQQNNKNLLPNINEYVQISAANINKYILY